MGRRNRHQTVVFGIDPGVTRTGVVATAVGKDGTFLTVAAATFHSDPSLLPGLSGRPTHQRVTDLAEEISDWCHRVLEEHPSTRVVVSIERPVYTHNAQAFEKQWRLFHAIVHLSVLFAHTICEVHNGTAKVAATGSGKATKDQMVRASSFNQEDFPDKADLEAVADAEAIGLAYGGGNPVFDTRWADPACLLGPKAEWFPDEGEDNV
jgi:Holliday junction resolvasome RuvABC endonuclease subunit